MKWGSSRAIHTLSLRGRNGVTDAVIHRVSNYPNDLSLRLLVPSGSPRAFSPRDDKVWEKSGLFPTYGNKLFLDQFMN